MNGETNTLSLVVEIDRGHRQSARWLQEANQLGSELVNQLTSELVN